MKSKYCFPFCILFFLLTSLGSLANLNVPPKLIGVDNVSLPNDSLMLMNSLLVDYHVDYDIAFATKNTNEIANSLHKIGLVYLRLKQLDLASNYGWRLLNVSEKYKLQNQTLFAYALLYKVNKEKGKSQIANSFLGKYNSLVSEISQVDLENSWMGIPTDSTISIQQEVSKKPLGLQFSKEPTIDLSAIENEASFIKSPVIYVVGFFLTVLLVFLWKGNVMFTKNVYHFNGNADNSVKESKMVEVIPVIEVVANLPKPFVKNNVSESIYASIGNDLPENEMQNKPEVIDPVAVPAEVRLSTLCKVDWLVDIENLLIQFSKRTDVKLTVATLGAFSQITNKQVEVINLLVGKIIPVFLDSGNLSVLSINFIDNEYGFVWILNGTPGSKEVEVMSPFTQEYLKKELIGHEGFQVFSSTTESNVLKVVIKTYYPSTEN